MPVREISLQDYTQLIGARIGKSEWFTVDQDRINLFAKTTEDEQFIHTDVEAAALTPFGGTIAHGFLTLSLLSAMAASVIPDLPGTTAKINYGMNSLRFLNPVAAGKRVRAIFDLKDFQERKPGNWQSIFNVTVEIENEERPALVTEWLTLVIVASGP
jgi:acyl dehydratase